MLRMILENLNTSNKTRTE